MQELSFMIYAPSGIMSFVSDVAAVNFVAVLRNERYPSRTTSITVPRRGAKRAPRTIQIATTFVGAAALDVFTLTDEAAWPVVASYVYRATIPRAMDDEIAPGKPDA